jgi:hypothetical protein
MIPVNVTPIMPLLSHVVKGIFFSLLNDNTHGDLND